MGMDDKAVDWFAESNRYATLLLEKELKAAEATIKHRPQKIVANGTILADLVEVVRCKDCVNWHKDTLFCDYMPYGDGQEKVNWYEDDFCSYGERREGE